MNVDPAVPISARRYRFATEAVELYNLIIDGHEQTYERTLIEVAEWLDKFSLARYEIGYEDGKAHGAAYPFGGAP